MTSIFERTGSKLKRQGISCFGKSLYHYAIAAPDLIPMTSLGVIIWPPKLKSVGMELTNACNLRCAMCPAHDSRLNGERERGYMSWELFTKVVDEIAILRDISVGLNFAGESLLHPKFVDMLRYAHRKGIYSIGFSTNGELLDRRTSREILKYCKGIIGVSIEGFKETHERIRRGSNYVRVLRNLDFLVSERERLRQPYPLVKVNLTRSDQLEQEVEEYIEKWVDLVDMVQVNEQLDKAYKIVSTNKFLRTDVPEKRLPCKELWTYMAVLWNGDIALCCHDLMAKSNLKVNARDYSIQEAWTSWEYKNMRISHLKGRYSRIPACSRCEAWAKHYICERENTGPTFVRSNGITTRYIRAETPTMKAAALGFSASASG